MKDITLKAKRESIGLSRESVAETLTDMGIPMTVRMLQDRENGVSNIKAEELVALCKIYDIDNVEDIKLTYKK